MFILSFYLFLILYAYGFTILFQLNLTTLTNPYLYLVFIPIILVSWILSFITQLFITYLFGKVREKNADPTNRLNHSFGVSLLNLGNHLLGIKVIVSGKENMPQKPFVLVGNHQENYDIMILKPIFKQFPLDFIAKESLFKTPIIGRMIKLLGNVPITKVADRGAAEAIVNGIKNVKKGIPMGIFPEGKRSFSNEMIEFKAGAFKLAMKPKADLCIVTIYDCADISLVPYKRNKAYVHIHPVLTYDEYKDLNSQDLSKKVKEIIQTKLDQFKQDLGH